MAVYMYISDEFQFEILRIYVVIKRRFKTCFVIVFIEMFSM